MLLSTNDIKLVWCCWQIMRWNWFGNCLQHNGIRASDKRSWLDLGYQTKWQFPPDRKAWLSYTNILGYCWNRDLASNTAGSQQVDFGRECSPGTGRSNLNRLEQSQVDLAWLGTIQLWLTCVRLLMSGGMGLGLPVDWLERVTSHGLD